MESTRLSHARSKVLASWTQSRGVLLLRKGQPARLPPSIDRESQQCLEVVKRRATLQICAGETILCQLVGEKGDPTPLPRAKPSAGSPRIKSFFVPRVLFCLLLQAFEAGWTLVLAHRSWSVGSWSSRWSRLRRHLELFLLEVGSGYL
jgi:hypothetical protein